MKNKILVLFVLDVCVDFIEDAKKTNHSSILLNILAFTVNLMQTNKINQSYNYYSSSKFDIHADGGAYCYVGIRASLCHGWASGPTSWLTEHVLDFKVLEPGSKTVQIKSNLGNLKFAEGTLSTPYGEIYVKHTQLVNR